VDTSEREGAIVGADCAAGYSAGIINRAGSFAALAAVAGTVPVAFILVPNALWLMGFVRVPEGLAGSLFGPIFFFLAVPSGAALLAQYAVRAHRPSLLDTLAGMAAGTVGWLVVYDLVGKLNDPATLTQFAGWISLGTLLGAVAWLFLQARKGIRPALVGLAVVLTGVLLCVAAQAYISSLYGLTATTVAPHNLFGEELPPVGLNGLTAITELPWKFGLPFGLACGLGLECMRRTRESVRRWRDRSGKDSPPRLTEPAHPADSAPEG
jgi:hypothetical protein